MAGRTRLTDAQERALRRLVDDGVLSAEQVAAVRAALVDAAPQRGGPAGWLAEVAGYVGGGLMLAGAALLLGTTWAELARGTRVGLLVGVAIALGAAGLLVAGGPRAVRELGASARRRVVGVLFALAAIPVALAVGTAADRHAVALGALAGTAVGVAGLVVLSTAPQVVVTAGLSMVALGTAADDLGASPVALGALFIVLGVVWAAVAVVGLVRPRALGLAVGAAIALVGGQLPLARNDTAPWAYASTLAVAACCFLLYWRERATILLVAGVLGVTAAVTEAIADRTSGALGGAVILLIGGGVLVATSALALRLRRPPTGRSAHTE
jgi:hypothetical protein